VLYAQNILINPIECLECEDLFCRDCMDKHLLNENKCPSCKNDFFKNENIGKKLKNMLFELKFNCPLKCGNVFNYEEKESHMLECSKLDCIACGKNIHKLDIASHLEYCEKKLFFSDEEKIYLPYVAKESFEKYFKKIVAFLH